MSRVLLTAVIAPPPHLLRKGAQIQRLTKTCEITQMALAIEAYAEIAERLGMFEAGGALTVLVQRAGVA